MLPHNPKISRLIFRKLYWKSLHRFVNGHFYLAIHLWYQWLPLVIFISD
jgi:hypothetical protein